MQQTVLERIAAGDPNAVGECLGRYGALVWSLARRHLKQHADAEDAVQEIFVEIWRSARRFDPAISSESAFITTISRRRLIDRQRKQSRRLATHSMLEEPVTPGRTDQDQLVLEEDAQRARALLERLRTGERRVLELTFMEGMTHSQIAEATSMPMGTVKTHTRRGLMRLREMLVNES